MWERLLEALPQIAGNPLAVVAYLLLIGAWTFWLFKRVQTSTFLKALEKLPDADRAAYAKSIDLPLAELANLSESGRVAILTKRYRLFAYLATLVAILILGSLITSHMRDEAALKTEEKVLKARIDEIEKQRSVVQEKLELQTRQLIGLATGVAETAGRLTLVSTPEVVVEANALSALVSDLQNEFSVDKLSAEQSESVNLAIATAMNAKRQYDKTLALISEDFQTEAVSRAVLVLKVRGDAFYGQQDWRHALSQYERVQSIQTHDFHNNFLIGNCELLLGNCEHAIEAFTRIIEQPGTKVPPSVRIAALNNRGDARSIAGTPHKAIDDFTASIDESKKDLELSASKLEIAMSLANRAFVYSSLNKDTESAADKEEVRRIIAELDSPSIAASDFDDVLAWLKKQTEPLGPSVLGHGQKSSCFMCHPRT